LAALNLNFQIAVVGIVKNSAKTLTRDVAALNEAFTDMKSVDWLLIESNSTDETVSQLEVLKQLTPKFEYLSLGQIGKESESRTIGMAAARNRYLEEIKTNPKYKDIDYFVVADFNGSNNSLSRESVLSCFERVDWDVCTANQHGPYYDIWALRHEFWQPNDCWRQLEFYRKFVLIPEKALFMAVNSKMLRIPIDAEWIEVDSAFGGLAIYKAPLAHVSQYTGTTPEGFAICEHVPFHEGLRRQGFRIFINPKLINIGRNDHSRRLSLARTIMRVTRYPVKLLIRFWNRF